MTEEQEKLLALATLGNNVMLQASIPEEAMEMARHLIEFNNMIIEELNPLRKEEEQNGEDSGSEAQGELEDSNGISDSPISAENA